MVRRKKITEVTLESIAGISDGRLLEIARAVRSWNPSFFSDISCIRGIKYGCELPHYHVNVSKQIIGGEDADFYLSVRSKTSYCGETLTGDKAREIFEEIEIGNKCYKN